MILMGLVQGFTEFLPVSSSGHLVIFQKLFGLSLENEVLFDTMLHLGTLVSIIIVFRRDVFDLARETFSLVSGIFSKKGRGGNRVVEKLLVMLIVATLPLFGAVIFKDKIEMIFGSALLVGFMLLATAAVLFATDRIKGGEKTEENASLTDALFVGLVQMIAVFPGISRSGSTIFAGRARGFSKRFAVRFSFLMSLISVFGAAILQIPQARDAAVSMGVSDIFAVFMAMLAAAISGIFAIKFLTKLLERAKFRYFAVYCFLAGASVIIVSLAR
jgi:undecaprenyl-diphosphatase